MGEILFISPSPCPFMTLSLLLCVSRGTPAAKEAPRGLYEGCRKRIRVLRGRSFRFIRASDPPPAQYFLILAPLPIVAEKRL